MDHTVPPAGLFGPFLPHTDRAEQKAQFRALAMGAAVYVGSSHPLIDMLRRAETDHNAAAEALAMFDRLPSLRRRHIIATFAAIMRPRAPTPHISNSPSAGGDDARACGATRTHLEQSHPNRAKSKGT